MNLSLEIHYTNKTILEYQYTVSFVKEGESETFLRRGKRRQGYFLVMNFDWIFRYQYLEIYALKFNLILNSTVLK